MSELWGDTPAGRRWVLKIALGPWPGRAVQSYAGPAASSLATIAQPALGSRHARRSLAFPAKLL
jgi:hypothetical protein